MDILQEEQAEPTRVLLEQWRQALDGIRPSLAKVGNRSRLFTADIERFRRMFDGMERVQAEAEVLLQEAVGEPDGYQQQGKLDEAAARLQGLWLWLRVATLQLHALLLADRAEDAGVVSTHTLDWLNEVRARTEPVLVALGGFDVERMERAAAAYGPRMDELPSMFQQWEASLRRGQSWSSKAIAALDAATLTYAAYQAYTALGAASAGRSPTLSFRFLGLATVGGTSGVGTVVISTEVLESLRKLLELGAISNVVLSAGTGGRVVQAELVGGQLQMAAARPGGPGKRPASKETGPGEWVPVKERLSPTGAKFQTQVSGHPPGEAYLYNGVRFDGFLRGTLLEAKGPGYLKFIKGKGFHGWFRGAKALTRQAMRQVRAARGIPVEWHVAEEKLADILRSSFSRDSELKAIRVIYSPISK